MGFIENAVAFVLGLVVLIFCIASAQSDGK